VDGPALIERVQARFTGAGAIVEIHAHRDDHTIVVDRRIVLDVLRFCRDAPDLGFDMLTDLTAVDYSKFPGREDGPRFEVVYQLLSIAHNHRLRVKVRVSEDAPEVPTAAGVWPIANWLEREVWDMFGIRFADHPDLRRLLLYEEFVGHPLRKDYPINRRQPLIGPQI
jgi:NADH-quinone oxidoreductase subunit C